MGNFIEIQHVSQRRFLNTFARCGRIGKAFEEIGMERTNHYKWLADPAYAAAFEEAKAMAADMLEDEAVRRAVDGVTREKGIYYQGEQVGTEVITEYSDTLLTFLLRGNKPGKYRDNVDITTGGKALRIVIDGGNDDNSTG